MGCYAGIDYGSRRIGLATAEDPVRIAFPAGMIAGVNDPGRDARAVLRWANERGISEFVVGLPLNMDDSRGPQADRCEKFAAALQRVSGKPVHLHDERLTSFAADQVLSTARRRNRTAGEKRSGQRDALAAQVILREWLESRHPPPEEPEEPDGPGKG